jgi:hypothetical protein
MSLQEFLNSNPVGGVTAEVPVSPRFKDKDGKPMLFTIRAMTQDEFESLRKRATRITVERGMQKVDFNSGQFTIDMVVEQTVDPNFKDAASLQAMDCATPAQYVNKVLLAGEVNELAAQINTLSGFGTNINTLVEEAKN